MLCDGKFERVFGYVLVFLLVFYEMIDSFASSNEDGHKTELQLAESRTRNQEDTRVGVQKE